MRSSVTLDRAGRVVLPKKLRDELRLSAGDVLDLSVHDSEITLQPRQNSSPLRKKDGIWVFASGEPLSTEQAEEALRKVRGERDRRNAGAE